MTNAQAAEILREHWPTTWGKPLSRCQPLSADLAEASLWWSWKSEKIHQKILHCFETENSETAHLYAEAHEYEIHGRALEECWRAMQEQT